MKRRKKKSGGAVLGAVLLAVLVIALLLGGSALMKKINAYGDRVVSAGPEKKNEGLHIVETTSPVAENMSRIDPACFSEEDGFLRYDDGTVKSRLGIDVSAYQGLIDWERVRADGIEFAVLRIGFRGYSEGKIQKDAYFEQNYENARAAGLDVGVYFFSQAISVDEAVEEADFVLSELNGRELQLPVFFDWESIEDEARSDIMNPIGLTGCAFSFCAAVEKGNYDAGVYFNQAVGYQSLNLQSLEDYTFWLAEYNETPSFLYRFELWQYSAEGRVDGINGNVDLDLRFSDPEYP